MTVRFMRESDMPALLDMHARSGFDYPFPALANMEAAFVVANEQDEPIAGFLAEKILQCYLLMSKEGHPAERQSIVRNLHDQVIPWLRGRGWHELNAFLPPQVEKSFGRRLMRTFGWCRNWASYCLNF